MEAENGKIRVLMFPWLAHGHVTPYLELAKKLSARNFHIYFCSTPVMIGPIMKAANNAKDDGKFLDRIEFVELHLPSSPQLPPSHHTTKGQPNHMFSTLKQACRDASPAFSEILRETRPDLLIYDVFQPWAPRIAESSLNIRSCLLSLVSVANIMIIDDVHELAGLPHDAVDIMEDVDQSFKSSCEIVLVKSLREVEGRYIDDLSHRLKKKVLPVGTLVEHGEREYDQQVSNTDKMIMEWLDEKEEDSVVFVSFGSEFYLSKEQKEELAMGLMLSGVSFIWVLRSCHGEDVDDDGALPPFGGARDKGLVVKEWAPQKRILSHRSVGGFVSHCGWGSVTESMCFGVPIIAMPMRVDQPRNAEVAAEAGVALVVEKDEGGGIYGREAVARALKEMMGLERSNRGENIKRKAKEMREIIVEKGDADIDDMIPHILRLCRRPSS